MSVDGKWNITINSPMGAQKATLDLKANGSALTGTQAGQQGSMEIAERQGGRQQRLLVDLDHLADADDAGTQRHGRWRQDFRQREGGRVRLVPVLGRARVKARRNRLDQGRPRAALFLWVRDSARRAQPSAGNPVRIPIHREGWLFIAIFALVNACCFWLSPWAGVAFAPLTIWCIAFFRDPERTPPEGENLLVSPADGVLLPIVEAVPPAELGLGLPAAPAALDLHERLQRACEPHAGERRGDRAGLSARPILQRVLRQGERTQ